VVVAQTRLLAIVAREDGALQLRLLLAHIRLPDITGVIENKNNFYSY